MLRLRVSEKLNCRLIRRILQCMILIVVACFMMRYAYYNWICIPHELQTTLRLKKNADDPLNGKIFLFIGDSICYGEGADGKSYPFWVKTYHPEAHVYNFGLGGMPMGAREDNEYTLMARIDKGEFEYFRNKADYIILQGGINDIIMGIPLGECRGEKNEPINPYTFCGGLEYALQYFTENFPDAAVYYMSTYPCKAQELEMQEEQWNAAEEIAAKWNITYIDLFHAIPMETLEGEYDTWLHAPAVVHEKLILPVIENVLAEVENE